MAGFASRRATARSRCRKNSPRRAIWSMPAHRWPIPGRSAPGAAISRPASRKAISPCIRASPRPIAPADRLFGAVRGGGNPQPSRLDHDLRRPARAIPRWRRRNWRASSACSRTMATRSAPSTPSPTRRPSARSMISARKCISPTGDGNDGIVRRPGKRSRQARRARRKAIRSATTTRPTWWRPSGKCAGGDFSQPRLVAGGGRRLRPR